MLALIVLILLQGTTRSGEFPGFNWGMLRTDVERRTQLEFLDADGSRATYRSGVGHIGSASLEECKFEFVADHLAGVIITTRGRDDSQALLTYLRHRFGDGQTPDPPGWSWFRSGTHITFDMDSFGDAYLYWYSLGQQR